MVTSLIFPVSLFVLQKWCRANQMNVAVQVDTTNSAKTTHRILKESFLRNKSTNNLSNLIKIIVEEFLPKCYQS